MKRWKLDPSGPRPVMPPLRGATNGRSSMGGTRGSKGGTIGFSPMDDKPCGGGIAAARSINAGQTEEYAPAENLNLHPCSKCGRNFSYDRITYHESVCKGDQKRRVFQSSKQRAFSGDDGNFNAGSFGRSATKGSKKKATSAGRSGADAYVPSGAQRTNWRAQHEEFISAIRSAKRADSAAQDMWGTGPSYSSARAPASGGRGAMSNTASTGGVRAPVSTKRVPPLMTRQNEARKHNMETGGRAAKATPGSVMTPGQSRFSQSRPAPRGTAFGGTTDRFSSRGSGFGGGGGGGGGGRILNDNSSSLGMLQAMGRA